MRILELFQRIKNQRRWIITGAALFLVIDIVITISLLPDFRPVANHPDVQETLPRVTETIAASETEPSATIEMSLETTPEAATTPSPTPTPTPKPSTKPTQTPTTEPTTLSDLIYQDVSHEQALKIFGSIRSVSDLIDPSGICELISFYYESGPFSLFAYRGLSESRESNLSYWFCDVFTTGQFELRICNSDSWRNYTILASKPLPAGYTAADAYDKYMRTTRPKNCIDQTLLNDILAAGTVEPFIYGSNQRAESSLWKSDDGQVLGFNFYMPANRSNIFIHEDYNTRELYYSVSQVPSLKSFMTGPYEACVPLSESASLENYRSGR